ncbi:hypothetical protein EZS27_027318 [termite gut metagenome]|uniref:Uncharacterized protein n=1 Tax=termite gut metagenome TaxID=433724 RepID=A0A5J4QRQ5_9ZZZZ
MIASLYICAKSFQHNGVDDEKVVWRKLLSLKKLIDEVDRTFNEFHLNNTDFLSVQLLPDGATIEDIIFKRRKINSDKFNLFLRLFKYCHKNNLSIEDLIEYLTLEDENSCNAIVILNYIDELPQHKQILYDYSSWLVFRRHFLSLYPKDSDYFIEECRRYFPALFFHKRNKETITTLLSDCTKKIVFYLSELNDKFERAKTVPYSRKETLKNFNTICSFDQKASDEGSSNLKKKSKKKKKDSFSFLNIEGNEEEICCDLHLKMLKNDFGKISTDRRIYFYEGKSSIESGKILIGHIGNHL